MYCMCKLTRMMLRYDASWSGAVDYMYTRRVAQDWRSVRYQARMESTPTWSNYCLHVTTPKGHILRNAARGSDGLWSGSSGGEQMAAKLAVPFKNLRYALSYGTVAIATCYGSYPLFLHVATQALNISFFIRYLLIVYINFPPNVFVHPPPPTRSFRHSSKQCMYSFLLYFLFS